MSILEVLARIPDPRMDGKVKHNLGSILFVELCSVLSGCESWSDITPFRGFRPTGYPNPLKKFQNILYGGRGGCSRRSMTCHRDFGGLLLVLS